ncbi:SpaA isopeptide-forming pilin-related protein [Trueperella pecoris]|nr:SpaA isopeptide-forming pilin-related protein [Trueperella pecoris]
MVLLKAIGSRRIFFGACVITICLAVVAGMLPGVQLAQADRERPRELIDFEDKSLNNRIKVSVEASSSSVPSGGGKITYTYTITNSREEASQEDRGRLGLAADGMYFQLTQSNVCNSIDWDLEHGFVQADSGEWLLPRGATVTGTCTTTITQNTTNTFMVELYDYYHKVSKATASTAVQVKYSGDAVGLSCDGLWFSSGSPEQKMQSYGVLGTINLSGYSVDPKLNFENVKATTKFSGGKPVSMNGSAALAVDPKSPENVYYVPRLRKAENERKPGEPEYAPGGLWVYNAKTGDNSQLTTWDGTPGTARLGVSPEGVLWSVASDGRLHRYDSQNKTWTNRGEVTLGKIGDAGETAVVHTFAPNYANSLQSGDLAFDGLGNMWIIGSDAKNGKSFLYTIPRTELEKNEKPISATMVGSMGKGRFNGIAFGPDGQLYGTTRDEGVNKGGLHRIDKKTGKATPLADLPYSTEDLGSCSLPKPELRIEKTANPTKAVVDEGEIEYTISITNTGNLEATGVTFQDNLRDHQLNYVEGSATLNNEKWEDGQSAILENSAAYVKSSQATHFGTVGANDAAIIKFKVKPNRGQTAVCNQARVNFTGNPQVYGIATNDPNTPEENDPTCTPVYSPAIGLDKKGVATAQNEKGDFEPKTTVSQGDDQVQYLYYVSTNPNQPKGMADERNENGFLTEAHVQQPENKKGTEELKDIRVTDDKCSPVRPVLANGKNVGDRNLDDILQADEKWQYECKQTLPLDKVTTNKAKVTATSVQSRKLLTDTDEWTVEPTGFKIEKSAKVTGADGVVNWEPNGSPVELKKAEDGKLRGTATYRVKVTNVGLIETFAPAITDDFSTPKGFVLEGLSWAEVDEAGHTGTPTPLGEDKPLPKVRIAKGASKTYEITAEVSVEDATQVDWEKARQCKTDKGGEPDFGLFNRVTMPRDADGEENNDACVPVTSPLLTVSVTKLGDNCDTDQRSCELPGASFSLYDADPTSADAKPLADAITVGENAARFTSKGLIAGTYWLVETAAPNGHVLMAEPVKFELGFDGIKLITTANASVAPDNAFHLRITDPTAGELPKAGSNGPTAFILAGIMLVAIGSLGYLTTTGCGPAWVRNRKGSQSRI